MQYHRSVPFGANLSEPKTVRVGARLDDRGRIAVQGHRCLHVRRGPMAAGLAAALVFTPVLAFAATEPVNTGLALGAAWIAFIAMVVVVAAMWRHFARRMLASLRPRWEDWG